MRPLAELINIDDPGWPIVQEWIAAAEIPAEILDAPVGAREAALYHTQVTTRSPMGAVVYECAGLMLDYGWLRILGAGGNPRLLRSLPEWNNGRTDRFFIVADDVLGGTFAMNGGGLGTDLGKIYYFAPDSLNWEPCGFGYSEFLVWAISTKLAQFYDGLRWQGWQAEVMKITGDQGINFFPFLFTKADHFDDRSRWVSDVSSLFDVQMEMKRQLDGR